MPKIPAIRMSPPIGPVNEHYEIRAIPNKGHGCFALTALPRGTRILTDTPLLIVLVSHYLQADIQLAFDKLNADKKALYFTLSSSHGQDPKLWPSRIHEAVEGRERQRIIEQHAARTGKEASLISIFQTNCMEMGKGAAVFPNAARFNHSCNPNACFTWNAAIGKETIHIMNDVQEGEEITLSYCDMLHDKPLRAYELKHYGFVCDCRACAEDENKEGRWAYESALRRFRLQELERETRFLRGKNLEKGVAQEGFARKLVEMAGLHVKEGDWTERLASVYLDIALVCEFTGDLEMALKAAAKACQVKKDCQGTDFPDFNNYSRVVQRVKAKLREQLRSRSR